jgi:hypothetical protein
VGGVRECTCLGSCRGAAGLASGWKCALAYSEALAEEDTYFETPGQRALEDATVALPYETMRDLVLR